MDGPVVAGVETRVVDVVVGEAETGCVRRQVLTGPADHAGGKIQTLVSPRPRPLLDELASNPSAAIAEVKDVPELLGGRPS